MRITKTLIPALVLTAGLCGFLISCGGESLETLREKCVVAAKNGDWANAKKSAEHILERERTDYTALFVSARASEAENETIGNFSDAIATARILVREHGDFDYEANHLLGRLLFKQSQPREATKYLAEAAELDTAANNNLALLGQAYMQLGDYAKAVSCFASIANDPFYGKSFQLYNELGVCYLHLNNYPQAETMFRKALELAERNSRMVVYLNLGRLYDYYIKDIDKALNAYRQFLIHVRIAKATHLADLVTKVEARGQRLGQQILQRRAAESAARRAAPNRNSGTSNTGRSSGRRR